MRLKMLAVSLLLLMGLVSGNLPVTHHAADLGPCRNCADANVVSMSGVAS
jgi:hypothetical protein